ncbi:MAG: BglG family transcription antiterminator [Candidatus Izemoplasmatales bacterium]|jgi:transcriptional antiterminator/mannitol/fructose-specific phosphotransferase system IIA component (Ntr-type)|nr:BglG family transcription antiterminator [Candidatus Izemoplasmatales bacterium]
MLDYKDYYLLNLISRSYQTLSVEDLAKLIGVSRRSIYYSINKINYHFQKLDIDPLNNQRNVGIKMSEQARQFLKKELDKELASKYVYKQKERIAYQILYMLTHDGQVGITDFEELFSVSRNTVINDTRELRNELSNFNLELMYDQQDGYVIKGDPLKIRSVALYIISSYNYLLKINSLGIYDFDFFNQCIESIKRIEKDLGVTYVNETKDVLAKVVSVIHKNEFSPIRFEEKDLKIIEAGPEYPVVLKYFKQLVDETEIHYITLQLMGLRVHAHNDFDSYDDELVHQITQIILETFKANVFIHFDDEKQLYEGLYNHFKSGIVRYKYGILYDNHLKEDIKEQYQGLYRIAKFACNRVEQLISAPISDDDVAYIAMHFGAHIRREKQTFKTYKLLLVCLNGVATSKMLSAELEMLTENIEIIDAVSLDEIEVYADEVDYIITTIPLDDKKYKDKTIFVNPVLTDNERLLLSKLFGGPSLQGNYEKFKTTLLNELKPLLTTTVFEKASELIESLSTQYFTKGIIKERNETNMLNELITKDHITFIDKVDSYPEALRKGAEVLIKNNYITEQYVEKVIENVDTLGPYIVVAPDVAISHARPIDGALKLGMSILILKEPVSFSDEKDRNARIIVTLSAPDADSHLVALGQLSELLMEETDKILNMSSKEEALALIDQYSNKS